MANITNNLLEAENECLRAQVKRLKEEKKELMDKARKWIINTYLGDYVTDEFGNGGIGDNVKLADDLCKAMEE